MSIGLRGKSSAMHHRRRPVTLTEQRDHGPGQFAYRTMFWTSTAVPAVQIPVPSHDVAAAVISSLKRWTLVIAAYDPNEGDSGIERRKAIDQTMACVRHAID